MSLSPATQALLDAAFVSKDAASHLDEAHQHAADELVLATKDEKDTADAALAGHAKASSDAHDALAAIAVELGFALPS